MSGSGRRWIANLAGLAGIMAAYLLRNFPPAQSRFYPRCPVFAWLHLLCPGCGGTRAMAALLHGRVAEAVHWNALAVALAPFAAAFFAASYWRAVRPGEFRWPTVPEAALKILLVVGGVFTVLRNLPGN
jgi:hypothetical protein